MWLTIGTAESTEERTDSLSAEDVRAEQAMLLSMSDGSGSLSKPIAEEHASSHHGSAHKKRCNVRVIIRARAVSEADACAVRIEHDTVLCDNPADSAKQNEHKPHAFTYDAAFDPAVNQASVSFRIVRSLLFAPLPLNLYLFEHLV